MCSPCLTAYDTLCLWRSGNLHATIKLRHSLPEFNKDQVFVFSCSRLFINKFIVAIIADYVILLV